MPESIGDIPIDLALDAANIGVWHWEPRTGAMNWNRQTESLCGLAADAPATLDLFLAGLHPEDKTQIAGAMLHAAVEGTRLSSECRVLNANTHAERWILIEGCKYLSAGPAVRMAGTVRDVSRRKHDDTQRETALREMEHRIRNVFAVVSAMVSLSERAVETAEELAHALRLRIGALDRAYGLQFAASNSVSVELRQVMETELAAFVDLTAIRISGPPIHLGRSQGVAVHLIAHELTTNALKYGALSHPGGQVEIQWLVRDNSLMLRWKERGAGPIAAPTRTGFGSRLLAQCARLNLGGDITYAYQPDGVQVNLVVPIARLGA